MEISTNLKLLTEKKIDFSSITLFGIKLGDSVDKINPTMLENKVQGRYLSIETNKDVGYVPNDNSVIIQFLMREKFLMKLNIVNTKQIVKLFGKPEALEKQNNSHIYFYQKKSMVILWDAFNEKLAWIGIGQNFIKQTVIGVNDFIEKYFDFQDLVPDYTEWELDKLKNNEPRYYRLQELQALMKAFEIGDDLQRDFEDGEFLDKRNQSDFEPIYLDIEKYLRESPAEIEFLTRKKERFKRRGREFQRKDPREKDIKMVYQYLFDFVKTIRQTLRYNSGWIATGTIQSRYIIDKTQRVLNSIDIDELDKIKHLLCRVISPMEVQYTINELINNYGYPDVDLQAIDGENY